MHDARSGNELLDFWSTGAYTKINRELVNVEFLPVKITFLLSLSKTLKPKLFSISDIALLNVDAEMKHLSAAFLKCSVSETAIA